MFSTYPSCASPWYLLLLALVPAVWWWSYRRLAGLGRLRRLVALGLRGMVLALLILALAEIQIVRTSDRISVLYLLDQTLSIPADLRKAMINFVNASISKHRRGDDRAGVVVFGRDAAIEVPPFDDAVQMASTVESPLDPEFTNLAAAMKLAQASFPEDAAKRVVIISDGNQNLGNALEQAQGLAAAGVGIDVVPVYYQNRDDVVVERVAIPHDIRRGEPFDLKVVVSSTAETAAGAAGEVRGRLVLSQTIDGQRVVLSDQPVALSGKKVFTVRQQIDEPNFYTYEARFVPDRKEDDAMPQNNRATAFTHVRGKGQVLLVESHEHKGLFDHFVRRLRLQGIEVIVRQSEEPFTSLADLQPFDTVILADVPREHFTDDQIQMLARNTQQMGAGLIMLGGQNSFGAGGWHETEVEKAMPVDFQVKSAKVVPCGALVLMMHASEIAQGNYWQKVVARESIRTLGPQDYCGLIHWNGTEQWLWGRGLLKVGGNRDQMLARVDRMAPGDMPAFDPAMWMAQKGFASVPNAAIKHMIVVSDGDPSAPSGASMNAMKTLNVTISTVAVGAHGPAESQLLNNIALRTGGKYYQVSNAKALPRIFQREARQVARPLIYENEAGMQLQVQFPHEMIRGVEDLPPIYGFVLTSKKENPLVEIALVSPKPAGKENNTVLAGWTYGLGKAVAFTSDAGARWTRRWADQPVYDKFFSQIVRWSMRPVASAGKFTVTTEAADGEIRAVVTALDKDDEFLNFLDMTATAVGPDLKPVPMKMQQTAPGRYVGTLPARDAGSYFLLVSSGAGTAPIRTGANVPFSDEFRDRATNDALLGQLAALVLQDGPAGMLIHAPAGAKPIEPLLAFNPFRHDLPKATSSQDAWYWMIWMAGWLFFFDVLVRRVQMNLTWVPALAGRARDWVLRRRPPPPVVQTMDRLRSRKEKISGEIEQIRASTRFEAPPQTPADVRVLQEPGRTSSPLKPPPAVEEKPEEETYTERLLRAKKKAWEGKRQEPKQP